jgi:hypothetical protein
VAEPATEYEWDPEDRRRLLALHETTTRDFDTTIRALAGGALGISIAFVHEIAKHPLHDWLLGVAWALFATALAVNMLSFLVSERAIRRLLRHMAEKAPTEEPKEPRLADRLNWGSAATLVGGLGFLVLFAVLNV